MNCIEETIYCSYFFIPTFVLALIVIRSTNKVTDRAKMRGVKPSYNLLGYLGLAIFYICLVPIGYIIYISVFSHGGRGIWCSGVCSAILYASLFADVAFVGGWLSTIGRTWKKGELK